jgi:hypothetical protein
MRIGILIPVVGALSALAFIPGCSGDGDNAGGDTGDGTGVVEYRLIGADRAGDLLFVDAGDGTTTPWLDTSYLSMDLGAVSAAASVYSDSDLAVASATPVGTLYVGTGGMGGAPDCNGCLFKVDQTTGDATLVVSASVDAFTYFNVSSMALAPDGSLKFTANDTYYTLDPSTDEASTPGGPGICCGFGMTYDLGGTLYITGDDSLYALDPVTGIATSVGTFTYGGFTTDPSAGARMVSMTTHPETGQVLGILNDGTPGGGGTGGSGPRYLVEVDVTTAEVTLIAQTDDGLDGLATVPFSVAESPTP